MRSAKGLAMRSVMESVLRSFIGSVLGSLSTCHELYRASQSSDQVITALIDKCRYRDARAAKKKLACGTFNKCEVCTNQAGVGFLCVGWLVGESRLNGYCGAHASESPA